MSESKTFTHFSKIDKPRLFIVSDTHFSHKNIIKYCARPFIDVNEMNDSLILRWNAIVAPQDTVLHLGDVGFNYGNLFSIVQQLNGHKLLVRGNHDWNIKRMTAIGFHCVTEFKNELFSTVSNDRMFICAHRPCDLPTWNSEKCQQMWYNHNVILCGHEHNNAPIFIRWVRDKGNTARPIMALNMSCEHWNYSPQPVERVIEEYDRHLKMYV